MWSEKELNKLWKGCTSKKNMSALHQMPPRSSTRCCRTAVENADTVLEARRGIQFPRPPPPRRPPQTVPHPPGRPEVTNRRAIFDLAAKFPRVPARFGASSRPVSGPAPAVAVAEAAPRMFEPPHSCLSEAAAKYVRSCPQTAHHQDGARLPEADYSQRHGVSGRSCRPVANSHDRACTQDHQ
jgi:hypothetical protein